MMLRKGAALFAGAAAVALLTLGACDGGVEATKAAAEDHSEDEHGAEEAPEQVHIADEAAQMSGIVVAEANAGAIEETLALTGRIALQPSARADVQAPYPGSVRAVLANIGDQVRRGQVLARVESAESLQTYAIVSPIDGVVLERIVNIGDVTRDAALFIVGDLGRVQAELNVAARDISKVAAGQSAVITGLDGANVVQARIASVLPTADPHSQTLTARAPLTLSGQALYRPGMAVRGMVVLSQQEVAIAVPRDAVQMFEGATVVFVRVAAETYEARAVVTGRAGRDLIEIVEGLAAGEAYVSENAFLVKAEIGKGSASHDH